MLISFLRTIILYLLLIASIRLMGKRQLGEMEPTEFVVTMLVANLAAVPMQESGIPLLAGAVPILVVLAMELLLSVLSYHSIRFRRLVCGKPVILIENGKLIQRNLQKTRVTPDELTEYLRLQGVVDLAQVKYAILRAALSEIRARKRKGRGRPGGRPASSHHADLRRPAPAGKSRPARQKRSVGARKPRGLQL